MLHERGCSLFTHADVVSITRLASKPARNLVVRLVNRGLATRLKPGLFILVPFELGLEREYLGNPYLVARELADTPDYYVSHASAMDLAPDGHTTAVCRVRELAEGDSAAHCARHGVPVRALQVGGHVRHRRVVGHEDRTCSGERH